MFKSKFLKSLVLFGIVAILSVPLFSSDFTSNGNDDCGLAQVTMYSNVNTLSASDDLNGGWKIFDWKIWGYVGNAWEVVTEVVNVVNVVTCWFGEASIESLNNDIITEKNILMNDLN
jgi:hypothetical protein